MKFKILIALAVIAALVVAGILYLNSKTMSKETEATEYLLLESNLCDFYENTNEILKNVADSQASEKLREYGSFSGNRFIEAKTEPISAFPLYDYNSDYYLFDISYYKFKQMISIGKIPNKNNIRIEQFINDFSYDYPEPEEMHSINIITEMQPSPWNRNNLLVRIGLSTIKEKIKDIPSEYNPYIAARDVKAQVEFNPAYVNTYRLIGYNGSLPKNENSDDYKEEGVNMRINQNITVFYEIIPLDSKESTAGIKNDELMNIKLRYRHNGESSIKDPVIMEAPIKMSDRNKAPSEDFIFASAVAMFGQLLQGSEFKGKSSYDCVVNLASKSFGNDFHGYKREFVHVVEATKQLHNDPASISAFGNVKEIKPRDVDDINDNIPLYLRSDYSYDKDYVIRPINSRRLSFKLIYNKYLKLKPGFSGKLKVGFTITKNGEAVDISILESTTGYAEFDNAIKEVISTLNFRERKQGKMAPAVSFEFYDSKH